MTNFVVVGVLDDRNVAMVVVTAGGNFVVVFVAVVDAVDVGGVVVDAAVDDCNIAMVVVRADGTLLLIPAVALLLIIAFFAVVNNIFCCRTSCISSQSSYIFNSCCN